MTVAEVNSLRAMASSVEAIDNALVGVLQDGAKTLQGLYGNTEYGPRFVRNILAESPGDGNRNVATNVAHNQSLLSAKTGAMKLSNGVLSLPVQIQADLVDGSYRVRHKFELAARQTGFILGFLPHRKPGKEEEGMIGGSPLEVMRSAAFAENKTELVVFIEPKNIRQRNIRQPKQ